MSATDIPWEKRELPEAWAADRPGLTLEQVWRLHGQTVVRWAARLGGPLADPDDIAQEVVLLVEKRLAGFRGGDGDLLAWLFSLTANVARHQRRKEQLRAWLQGSAQDYAGDLEWRGANPAEALEQRRALRRVQQVLDGLSEKYRTVLILFEVEQYSGEEIARLTGLKLKTVWVHLHRGRALFLERMRELQRQEATHG